MFDAHRDDSQVYLECHYNRRSVTSSNSYSAQSLEMSVREVFIADDVAKLTLLPS
jgi:hypothetical protein